MATDDDVTTPQRRKFTRDEREKIIGFYGQNCVITGDSNIDLDHLVDKPCRNEIADAAPVARTLNRPRGGYKPLVKSGSPIDELPAPLYPEFLDRTQLCDVIIDWPVRADSKKQLE